MTRHMLFESLKKMGVKRATLDEYVHQLGSELVVQCRPMPSDSAKEYFENCVRPAGVQVEFYLLPWWKNIFKRFKVQEHFGPRPPRHHNCRCVVQPLEGKE